MAERFRRRLIYTPPPLDKWVRLVNPDDGSTVECYAGRRDQAPHVEHEEGVQVFVGVYVWVIRHRPQVAPNVEVVFPIRPAGVTSYTYESLGPPVERGGPQGGRAERYLEIHTEQRR